MDGVVWGLGDLLEIDDRIAWLTRFVSAKTLRGPLRLSKAKIKLTRETLAEGLARMFEGLFNEWSTMCGTYGIVVERK